MPDSLPDRFDELPEAEKRKYYEQYVLRNEASRNRPGPAYARGALAGALAGTVVSKALKEISTASKFTSVPLPNLHLPYRYSMPAGALVGMGATAWERRGQNKKTASFAESKYFYVNPKSLKGVDTTVEDLATLPLSAQARRDIISNNILIRSDESGSPGAESPGGGYVALGGKLPPGPRAASLAHEVAHYKNRDFSKLMLRKLSLPLATGLTGYVVGSKFNPSEVDPTARAAYRTIGAAAGAYLGNRLVNLYDAEKVEPRADAYAAQHAGAKNLEDAILAGSAGRMVSRPGSSLVRAAQRLYTGTMHRHQPAWKRIQTLRERSG